MPAPADATRISGVGVDLSPRVVRSGTVAGSPAAAAETIVCTITVPVNIPLGLGIILFGYAAYTVGTSGTAVNLRLRQTDTSGTILKASGAMTRTAGNLAADSMVALDASPVLPNQVYVLTMTVTAGAAASTVSAAELIALLV